MTIELAYSRGSVSLEHICEPILWCRIDPAGCDAVLR